MSDRDSPDPRIPSREAGVLPHMLDAFAAAEPDRTFAVFDTGESWSYATARAAAQAVAAALRGLGTGPGDKVLIWLPNGPLALRAWFGANYGGAVSVAINTAYRGAVLEHVIVNSDAEVAICHPDLVGRLLALGDLGRLRTVLTDLDALAETDPGCASRFAARGLLLVDVGILGDKAEVASAAPVLKPWDLQSICYTSGTTGPSKGVLSSYLHLRTMGWHCTHGVTRDDRYLINLPLFHVGGTLFVMGALARGASIAVMGSFKTETFLADATRLGATQCLLLGAMAGFLLRAPKSPADRQHSFRRLMVIPLSVDVPAMVERFGVEIVTLFNMSEVSAPIISDVNPTVLGSSGRLRAGVEARLVDDHDCEVPTGSVGELVLRSDTPWTMSHGYYKMPEATAQAWRNGWFHTGDAFRVDAEGNYFFVDRLKDAIRRRGENISSFEVEEQVLAYDAVLETAVVGVESVVGEQDVLAVVTPKPGQTIAPADLLDFLIPRLPHFMVPRYVRVMSELPKTPTSKIEKHKLRDAGVTADTWDREQAGITIKRDRLHP